MKKLLNITIGLLLTAFGYGQTNPTTDNGKLILSDIASITFKRISVNHPDTLNQDIYDFMKIVIVEQELDLSFGVAIEPEHKCDLSQDDKTFLKSLLIEPKKQNIDTIDSRNNIFPVSKKTGKKIKMQKNFTVERENVSLNLSELKKCLTQSDIETMLSQKENLTSFQWNNSRLGFDLTNRKNWYCFSIPLFSNDRQKAVMMIQYFCYGLCGGGSTVLFTKENNKWTSQIGGIWIH